METHVNELPELRSDQDVDALLARLRAKIAPAAPQAPQPHGSADPSSNALADFLTAQGEATATMVRALHMLADTIDELAAETHPGPMRAARRRLAPSRRMRSQRKRR